MSYISNQETRFHKRRATFEILSRISANEFNIKIIFDIPLVNTSFTMNDLEILGGSLTNFVLAADKKSATVNVIWASAPNYRSNFTLKIKENDFNVIAESSLIQTVSPHGNISYSNNLMFPINQTKTSMPTVAGGAPSLWSYDPPGLPPGLTFDSSTGAFSGTALNETSQTKTITATNSAGSVNGTFTIIVKPALVSVTQNVVFETGIFRNWAGDGLIETRPSLIQLTFSDPIKLSDNFFLKWLHSATGEPIIAYQSAEISSGKLYSTMAMSGVQGAYGSFGLIASGLHSSVTSMISVLPGYMTAPQDARSNSASAYYVKDNLRLVIGQYYSQITLVNAYDFYDNNLFGTHQLLEGFGVDQYGRPTAQTSRVSVYHVGIDP